MLTILLLLLPLLGSLLLFIVKSNHSKFIALGFSLISLFLALGVGMQFSVEHTSTFEIGQKLYFSPIRSAFHFGIGGLSLLMLFLTNALIPIIIFSSFKDSRPNQFYALILLMQFGLIGLFLALDGLMFYIFWELTLIPIWFICGIYGTGENKTRINLKFFIYTFFGSLFMLVALIYAYTQAGSFDFKDLYAAEIDPKAQIYLFWMFFIAFAIKLPIFPFHTWQADTYTMAPTQGSMLLSGIMLKMGVFGMLVLLVPLTPYALGGISGSIALVLSIVGIVYASLIAVVQKDIKRLIAFSSMAHVGLIAAGILASSIVTAQCGTSVTGFEGASFQMLAHGINVVGLFYAADLLIRRFGTRDLSQMGGLASKAPIFAVLFMIVSLGSMGLPLTNAFIGEFLLLKAVFTLSTWATIFAGLTLILGAVYVTKMYGMAMFGQGNKEFLSNQKDISCADQLGLGILAVLVFVLGIFPQPLLNLVVSYTSQIAHIFNS
ncbi:NADH-quinone oxidoreductase subunit M [Apibacter muscae]|uniref:complex I subunit 4 family protein n=1 Tax=Apibacter muscae TaxID=2509004 RepID=UPI0011AD88E3|nr:NADH-quinone oxidoreductase subunit M [Apibacter muscae]TWP31367.1 NADH-quinone oxidoreductase subunit M [Apibacter muscae]